MFMFYFILCTGLAWASSFSVSPPIIKVWYYPDASNWFSCQVQNCGTLPLTCPLNCLRSEVWVILKLQQQPRRFKTCSSASSFKIFSGKYFLKKGLKHNSPVQGMPWASKMSMSNLTAHLTSHKRSQHCWKLDKTQSKQLRTFCS